AMTPRRSVSVDVAGLERLRQATATPGLSISRRDRSPTVKPLRNKGSRDLSRSGHDIDGGV
ncbi:MAG: hypothetical protein J2P17_12540, partial [Mycobacterium sp.]|nr:hypothetical protein [Mycobacterium sp.]